MQQAENLMGILKRRTKRADHCHEGTNLSIDTVLHLTGKVLPSKSSTTLRSYATESLESLGGRTNRANVFKVVKILARFWRGAIGIQ